jgi:hypothetical protein
VPHQLQLGTGAWELATGGRPEPIGGTIAFTVRSGTQEETLKRQPAAFAALVAAAGSVVFHGKQGGQGASQFRQHIGLLKRHVAAGSEFRTLAGSSQVAIHPGDGGRQGPWLAAEMSLVGRRAEFRESADCPALYSEIPLS